MSFPLSTTSREVSFTSYDPVSDLAEVMNKFQGSLQTAQAKKSLDKSAQSAKTSPGSIDNIKAIEQNISTGIEGIPWLIEQLGDVAKIHPFIAVAVFAFKVVYTMEMTRRENDRRIQALYVEMKDMMAVLIQLREIHGSNVVGPDGKTIEDRLQNLVTQTAVDIKDCAKACDTYSKKRLVVKILRGQPWEAKLMSFANLFNNRRDRFEQELAIHTARVVQAIHRTIETVNERLQMIFDKLVPQDLAELKQKAKDKGDINILVGNLDISALKELNEEEENLLSSKSGNEVNKKRTGFTVEDLKRELRIDFDTSLKANSEAFEGKFNLYYRQLKDDLSWTIDKANSRVIDAVREGPHDKIKNEELRMIWKEMGWRRNVKARPFVMTLRDHFREKVQEIKLGASVEVSKEQPRTDDWALDYISVAWLQPIMEAFDDDGSGYITIAEINQFTDAIPKDLGWSLQHWIAYWAIGWQYSATLYIEKIRRITASMDAFRTRVLPENRPQVEYYLDKISWTIVCLTAGLTHPQLPEDIKSKFQPFIDYEEARILENLQDIKYNLDAPGPVHTVAGHGRIDKYIFPLVYLLIERDFKIFRVAQHKELHSDELQRSVGTLLCVFHALDLRVSDLKNLLKHQKEDSKALSQSIASGLVRELSPSSIEIYGGHVSVMQFRYIDDTNELWATQSILNDHVPQHIQEDDLQTDVPLEELTGVLNIPSWTDRPYDTQGYESPEVFDFVSDDIERHPIFGQWNGYIYSSDEYPLLVMSTLRFQSVPDDENEIQGSGMLAYDYSSAYTIKGKYSTSNGGDTEVRFTIHHKGGDYQEYFNGHLDENGSLVGYQDYTEDVSEKNHNNLFILRRVPAEVMAYRPSPAELSENKPRALWRFVLGVVRMRTLRKLFSWSFFKERRDVRKRYIELNIRYWFYGKPLSDDEMKELVAFRRLHLPADALYYLTLRNHVMEVTPNHFGCTCDVCHRTPLGGRIICLDCRGPPHSRTVNFCTDTRCYSESVARDDLESEHLPTHDIVKIRTTIQWYDLDELLRSATTAIEQWRLHSEVPIPDAPQTTNSDEDVMEIDSDGKVLASPQELPTCFACFKPISQPFWYCTRCIDCMICDSCEHNSLLPCVVCKRQFEQPSWFYGSRPNDQFLCNRCTLKGVKPAEAFDKQTLHTYLHPLVRCKERIEDPVTPPLPSVEARLENLEERLAGIEQTLVLLQQNMVALLDPKLRDV